MTKIGSGKDGEGPKRILVCRTKSNDDDGHTKGYYEKAKKKKNNNNGKFIRTDTRGKMMRMTKVGDAVRIFGAKI